jgi:hypothetical protein
MQEFEVVELEDSAATLEFRAERERERERKWARKNRTRLAHYARERYRRDHYRTCPGTEDDPYCSADLTSTRCVRCDYHAHEHAKALGRARYHEKKEQANAR